MRVDPRKESTTEPRPTFSFFAHVDSFPHSTPIYTFGAMRAAARREEEERREGAKTAADDAGDGAEAGGLGTFLLSQVRQEMSWWQRKTRGKKVSLLSRQEGRRRQPPFPSSVVVSSQLTQLRTSAAALVPKTESFYPLGAFYPVRSGRA